MLLRQRKVRERSPGLARKKRLACKNCATLCCKVCGFDFKETYGDLGEGFIECHHATPLSELQPGSKTRLQDLALVCANCHWRLHRAGSTVWWR
ncbi:MAG: HNH endonuclease [bacterium]